MIRDYIADFNTIDDQLRTIGTSGYVLAVNIRYIKPEVIEVTYPTIWWEEYRKRMYVSVDPIAKWCASSEGIKRWTDIGRDATFSLNNIVMKRAKKHGLNYGMSMACKNPEYTDGWSFLSVARPDREITDAEGEEMWSTFLSCTKIIKETVLLKKDELISLELAAQGYTQKEIARELGKSPAYVKLQLASATRTLRGTSTTHAIAIAQQRGMIEIPGGMRW